MPKVNLFLPFISGIHDCRHQVYSSEAVVQRLLEEDAFKQKRYNHPLGYIINMILTYFERKVNLLGVIHRLSTVLDYCPKLKYRGFCQEKRAERVICAGIIGNRIGFLPEKVAPPLWYVYYFRESRTIPTSMSCQNGMHLGGSSPLSRRMHREASGSEGFWTTMVYHYGICMGETVYTAEFS